MPTSTSMMMIMYTMRLPALLAMMASWRTVEPRSLNRALGGKECKSESLKPRPGRTQAGRARCEHQEA